jgi:drug/metabolite transporter (DMT)-like permease
MTRRPRIVVLLSFALVTLNAVGNCCLSLGMRSRGATDYAGAATSGWVIAGVVLLIGWMLAQLSLLSWADLTYVLPISAASFVGSAVLGAVVLGEHVSAARWCGIALIAAGIAIVGRTRPRTGPVE